MSKNTSFWPSVIVYFDAYETGLYGMHSLHEEWELIGSLARLTNFIVPYFIFYHTIFFVTNNEVFTLSMFI